MAGNKPQDRPTLESWKEIADHFRRSVRTVQRWDRLEGLPVRRKMHTRRPSVFAYKDELQAWWDSRPPDSPVLVEEESQPMPAEVLEIHPAPTKRWLVVLAAPVGTVFLGLMIWIGRSPATRFEVVVPATRLLAGSTCDGCRMERIGA
jgi:hypothetical protein